MYDLDLLYGNLIQVIALPTLKNSFGEVRASLGLWNRKYGLGDVFSAGKM